MFNAVFVAQFGAEGLESLTLRISDAEFVKCEEGFKRMALMTTQHRLELRAAKHLLSSEIIVSEDLLRKLSVTEHHKQVIRQAAGHVEQVKKLLAVRHHLMSTRLGVHSTHQLTQGNWTESSRHQTNRILPRGGFIKIFIVLHSFAHSSKQIN